MTRLPPPSLPAIAFDPSLRARTRMAVIALAFFVTGPLQALPGDPSGGCPAPPNALVISEVMVGMGNDARWIEITNPGTFKLSLAAVTLQISGEKGGIIASFPLGGVLPLIQGYGQAWALGTVPSFGPLASLLKAKVLELGESFVLPPCHGKIALVGPTGVIDAFEYELCKSVPKNKATVLALDPGYTDPCKNDEQNKWCLVPPQTSPFGTPGSTNPGCDLDGDGIPSTAGDCDDLDAQVNQDKPEICNGKDDDCNGQTDDDLTPPPGLCPSLGICAQSVDKNGAVQPGAVAHCEGAAFFTCDYPMGYESANETLCDGYDNDCDGLTDENLLNACGKCGALAAEVCNGKDDNCNGKTDEGVTLTGLNCGKTGVCLEAQGLCVDGTPTCVPSLAWQATETLCDGRDNDCDGDTDEVLGSNLACTSGVGECATAGTRTCGMDGQVVCDAPKGIASQEICGNGKDDNCDGQTDEGFDVGSQCEIGRGVCHLIGKKLCSLDRLATMCSVNPGIPDTFETCGNGLDDNCDGQTDEAGCKDPGARSGRLGCGNDRGRADRGALAGCLAVCALILRFRRRARGG